MEEEEEDEIEEKEEKYQQKGREGKAVARVRVQGVELVVERPSQWFLAKENMLVQEQERRLEQEFDMFSAYPFLTERTPKESGGRRRRKKSPHVRRGKEDLQRVQPDTLPWLVK